MNLCAILNNYFHLTYGFLSFLSRDSKLKGRLSPSQSCRHSLQTSTGDLPMLPSFNKFMLLWRPIVIVNFSQVDLVLTNSLNSSMPLLEMCVQSPCLRKKPISIKNISMSLSHKPNTAITGGGDFQNPCTHPPSQFLSSCATNPYQDPCSL